MLYWQRGAKRCKEVHKILSNAVSQVRERTWNWLHTEAVKKRVEAHNMEFLLFTDLFLISRDPKTVMHPVYESL